VTALHHITALLADTPKPSPSCHDAPEVCGVIYQWTGSEWFAVGSYVLLVKPLRILLIVLFALAFRWLVHRTITRLIRTTANGRSPALLRPLKEKAPARRDANGGLPERRRQRAEALGSVLRSISSAVIFSVAFLMVLAELGLDLAPLLASAGIAGIAVGFGAQNLVKDFLAGVFMLLEDQYGVGDIVDLGGDVNGTVEAVGLRVTTVRDARGVVWYIRNGEITRVGNKSQSWAVVMVDMPIGFAGIDEATGVLRAAAARFAEDADWKDDLIAPPEVLGVEQITTEGAVIRTTAKTTPDAQWRVGRELRRRLTEGLDEAGIVGGNGAGRVTLANGNEGGPAAEEAGGLPLRSATPGAGATSTGPAAPRSSATEPARRGGTDDGRRSAESAAADGAAAGAAGAAGAVSGVSAAEAAVGADDRNADTGTATDAGAGDGTPANG
jgi:small conductance mechanosensitive channel